MRDKPMTAYEHMIAAEEGRGRAAMTAAPAPLTCEEEAKELCPCRCVGSLQYGHTTGCPADLAPAVAAALRARQMAGRREAADHFYDMTKAWQESRTRIGALPEVP